MSIDNHSADTRIALQADGPLETVVRTCRSDGEMVTDAMPERTHLPLWG